MGSMLLARDGHVVLLSADEGSLGEEGAMVARSELLGVVSEKGRRDH